MKKKCTFKGCGNEAEYKIKITVMGVVYVKWCSDCAHNKQTQKRLGYNMFTDATPYF